MLQYIYQDYQKYQEQIQKMKYRKKFIKTQKENIQLLMVLIQEQKNLMKNQKDNLSDKLQVVEYTLFQALLYNSIQYLYFNVKFTNFQVNLKILTKGNSLIKVSFLFQMRTYQQVCLIRTFPSLRTQAKMVTSPN